MAVSAQRPTAAHVGNPSGFSWAKAGLPDTERQARAYLKHIQGGHQFLSDAEWGSLLPNDEDWVAEVGVMESPAADREEGTKG